MHRWVPFGFSGPPLSLTCSLRHTLTHTQCRRQQEQDAVCAPRQTTLLFMACGCWCGGRRRTDGNICRGTRVLERKAPFCTLFCSGPLSSLPAPTAPPSFFTSQGRAVDQGGEQGRSLISIGLPQQFIALRSTSYRITVSRKPRSRLMPGDRTGARAAFLKQGRKPTRARGNHTGLNGTSRRPTAPTLLLRGWPAMLHIR